MEIMTIERNAATAVGREKALTGTGTDAYVYKAQSSSSSRAYLATNVNDEVT